MDLLGPVTDIVQRLKDQLGTLAHVEAFPNDPDSFDFTAAEAATVLVRYQGSGYSTPVPNRAGVIVQERTGRWYAAILHENLQDESASGIYPVLEAVRVALTGYTPANMEESTPLYPVQDAFMDRKPGKWIYQITFAQVAPEVQV